MKALNTVPRSVIDSLVNTFDPSTIVIQDTSRCSIEKVIIDKKNISLNKILNEVNVNFSIEVYNSIQPTKVRTLIYDYLKKLGDIIAYYSDYIIIKNKLGIYIVQLCNKIDKITSYVNFEIFSDSIENIDIMTNYISDVLFPLLSTRKYIKVSWYYSTKNSIDWLTLTDEINDTFIDEAYPYLDIKNLALSYLKSDEPILVLMGPPGTGKTRLIRYMFDIISKELDSNIEVTFTSDQQVIESGSIFLSFLQSDSKFMVLEDIDYHLQARKDGNTCMYNFLSISNGLAVNQQKDKKIILSTNLPNVKNIDPALLRPGRCFSTITTRELFYDESVNLLNKLGITTTLKPEKSYTIAELYNMKINKQEQCFSTGFI